MEGRSAMIRGHGRRHAVLLLALALPVLAGALSGTPAAAFETPLGNKNFMTPSSVPNYFSNEAAPFGRASQSAMPGADRFNTATAPIPMSRTPAAASRAASNESVTVGRARYRGKSAASRSSRSHVRTAHGRSTLARLPAQSASSQPVAARQPGNAKQRSRDATRLARHTSQNSR
jgi:hypothetical protein